MVASAGSGPVGTAANGGKAGSGPTSTISAWTAVSTPTAKPGPEM